MADSELDQFFDPKLQSPAQPRSSGGLKDFLKGGVFGIGTIPADFANLIGLPGTLYSLGKELYTGEPTQVDRFSSTLNEWADRYRAGAGELLGVEQDAFGTPSNDAGDAGYVLSQFALPSGLLAKLAAKAPKIIRAGAAIGDQVLSRSGNKYFDAAAISGSSALSFYGNTLQDSGSDSVPSELDQFFETEDEATVADTTELDQFFTQSDAQGLDQFFNQDHRNEGGVIHDTIKYGAPALVGLASAVLLHRAMVKAGTRNRLNSISENFGINDVETITPKSVKLKQGLLDRNASVKEIYRNVDPAKADEFDALVDVSQSTGSVETMFSDLARTGRIAGSDIKLPKMTEIYSQVSALPPDKQKLLQDAMDAGDRLTDFRERGFKSGNPIEQQLLLDTARADQVIGPIMKSMKGFYEGMAKYMYDEGLIDKDLLQLFQKNDFVYLPEYVAEAAPNYFDRFVNALSGGGREFDASTGTTSLFKRQKPLPQNVKRMNPLDAMEQYTLSMLDYAHANKIRRQFVDTMSSLGKADKRYGKLFTVADDAAKADIRVYRNGKASYYNIHDATVKDALKFAPQRLGVFWGTMNKLRQIKQATTTGKLRPTQAIRSAIYDIWTGANVTPSALGNYIRKQEGPTFGLFPGDFITTIPSVMGRGLWENAKGRIADNVSRLLTDSVNHSGVLAGMIGPARATAVANKLADVYSDSVLSMFRRVGASSLGNLHDISTARGLRTMMNQIDNHLSGHPNAARLMHFYDGLLESLHSSVRLGYFAKNYAKMASKEPDLARLYELSRSTRQLTGDPGIQGAGELSRIASASVPYYNIGLQTVRQLTKSFAQRPVEVSGAILTSTVLPALATAHFMSEDEESRDWFWNELSPYERVSNIFVPSGNGGKPLSITLPNELRPFYAMSLAWFDTLFGYSNGSIYSDANRATRDEIDSWLGVRAAEDIGQGFKLASPLTETGIFENPLIAAGLAFGGGKRISPGGDLIDIAPKQIDGPGDVATKLPGDILSAELDEVLRATFGVVARDGLNLMNTTFGSYRDSQDEIAAFDAGLDQYALDVGSRFPIVGYTIHPETKKKSLDTVDSRLLYNKLDGIKAVQTIVTENIRQAGLLKTGDYAVAAPDMIEKQIADPRMQPIFIYANAWGQNINERASEITFMRDRYKAESANYRTAPKEKAKVLNQMALHLLALEQQANTMIRDAESMIEDQIWRNYGVHKVFRFDDVSKDTTLDDLPDR